MILSSIQQTILGTNLIFLGLVLTILFCEYLCPDRRWMK